MVTDALKYVRVENHFLSYKGSYGRDEERREEKSDSLGMSSSIIQYGDYYGVSNTPIIMTQNNVNQKGRRRILVQTSPRCQRRRFSEKALESVHSIACYGITTESDEQSCGEPSDISHCHRHKEKTSPQHHINLKVRVSERRFEGGGDDK
ncbi:hypothetical protein F2P81_000609 [Scophthalmus maximus]|uniref:Uncharacterized protein n=1 Tax=Scophthalmus maximus TaxID=52904 RepID=A0A6A4TH82_SCOMX|nr:hypothetical protein F2P81_000609 [Scophthalmus maximus]